MRLRARIIINPVSGTSSKTDISTLAIKVFGNAGIDLDVRYTTAAGDATRLAREAVELGYYAVLAAGGDGTINETACALCDTGVALGIIPCGSGNGLARHLAIPLDPEDALTIAAAGIAIDCDYGTVNNRKFFCTFGVGFDAAVSHHFARQRRRGPLSYIKSAISEYVKFRPDTYTIACNGEVITRKAMIVAVCNASQYGNNAYIAPHASITDGLLDITVVGSGTPIAAALMGVELFTGTIDRNTTINTFRVPQAEITRTSGSMAHLDGEPVEMGDTMHVECHPRGLKVFVDPSHDAPFRPFLTPLRSFGSDLRAMFRAIRRRNR